MSELALERDQRLALKAQAHHLNPVVLLGTGGLSAPVLKEIDRALLAHELIKVRIPIDEREAREQTFQQIADQLGAARVVMIGKIVVLYRPRPTEDRNEPGADRTGAPVRSPKAPARMPAPKQLPGRGPGGRTAGRDEVRRIGRTSAPRRGRGRGG
jgi:putative YhbY family RNA-binding protein